MNDEKKNLKRKANKGKKRQQHRKATRMKE